MTETERRGIREKMNYSREQKEGKIYRETKAKILKKEEIEKEIGIQRDCERLRY